MSGALRRFSIERWVRDLDRDAREELKRAAKLATTFGPCAVCGRDVGADGVHTWDCHRVPTDRRDNRGRAPT